MRTNLKVLRVKNHLTQVQMADEVGVGRQTYAAVEVGKQRGNEEFWNAVQNRFDVPDSEMWGLMRND